MSGPTGAQGARHPEGRGVRCPFCGAHDAEPLALFGSQLLTEQWYCRACRTPFERVKNDDESATWRVAGSERQAT